MKNSTEYLFGRSRDAYEPHLTVLASRRIVDAKILLKKLAGQRDLVSKEELPNLIKRYNAVREALDFWENILKEDT